MHNSIRLPTEGFVNPVLVPQYDDSGEILDVQVRLPNSFAEQMLQYSATYNGTQCNKLISH